MASRKRKTVDDLAGEDATPTDVASTVPREVSASKTESYYRTLYLREPSFHELGKQDADFAAVQKDNGQLDFSDPKAVMQLTKTLLKLDFGLKIDLPDDRLCPPVPNRHNYILWLKDLLDSASYDAPGGPLRGLDIGTGASCIYPLLGTAQRPWRFIATDIDSKNLEYAKKNVELNGLQNRIRIVSRRPRDSILALDDLGLESLDFVMTNPPFYLSEDDMTTSANKKALPPHSACSGAPVEMVCEGGEVAFVNRILAESLVLRERVQWYTSMFGKVTSLETFIGHLRKHGIDNYAITEFLQGNKTKRWAVGWSFGAVRPADDAARGMKNATWKKLWPAAVQVDLFTSPGSQGVGDLVERIQAILGPLELLSWAWDSQRLNGIGQAKGNVWSRAWRRRRLQGGQEPSLQKEGERTSAFGFCVSVHVGLTGATTRARWVEGHDETVFESFCGFLKGRLKTDI